MQSAQSDNSELVAAMIEAARLGDELGINVHVDALKLALGAFIWDHLPADAFNHWLMTGSPPAMLAGWHECARRPGTRS